METIILADLIVSGVLLVIGFVGDTARYLHEEGMHDGHFDKFRYMIHALVGAFVALMSGFITTHFGIEGSLQHGLVGIAACSSRELLDVVPGSSTSLSGNTSDWPPGILTKTSMGG